MRLGADPLAASRVLARAKRVRHQRRFPVAVFLVVPIVGFLRVRVVDFRRFVVEPSRGLDGVHIVDLHRGVLVPVVGFGRLRVLHLRRINPVGRFRIFRIVDGLRGVERGLEGIEE